MGKKKNKNKAKKVNPKKEKYAKFHREKSAVMDMHFPELTDDQSQTKKVNEDKIGNFLRFNRNKPTLSLREKSLKRI